MSRTLNPLNYSHTDIMQLNEFGLDIAFSLGATPLPKEMGEIKFELVKREFDGFDYFGTLQETRTTIEMEQCTLENFNNTDKAELQTKGLRNR
mmetsp:Transcript_11573/g.8454  ORF Transcript_11573/g.8454 Transcript_11573/m.8454 type:complete len:93 (+) Transcript_11573:14-292(+)